MDEWFNPSFQEPPRHPDSGGGATAPAENFFFNPNFFLNICFLF
jgi:hypothetical protein